MQLRKIKTFKLIKFLINIKELLALQKDNKILRQRNERQQKVIKDLKEKLSDPRLVVESMYAKGIQWYDPSEMPIEKQRRYYNDCQMILNSMAWNNIKNYNIAQITQACVVEHNPKDGLDRVRDTQMTINGIELMANEFEDCPNPDAVKTEQEEDINRTLNF